MPIFVDELLSKQVLCDFIFPVCDKDQWIKIDIEEYIFDLMQEKSEEAASNNFINQLYVDHDLKNPSKTPIKVALISDLHLDFDYTPGMSSNCGRPLCCRSESGIPDDPKFAAGKWGNYNCDVPERTVSSMLDFVASDLKPDAVFWLGDSIPHNVDSLNLDSNIEIVKNVTQLVADGLKDYKVFPAMGNHDTYP